MKSPERLLNEKYMHLMVESIQLNTNLTILWITKPSEKLNRILDKCVKRTERRIKLSQNALDLLK